jgi:bifunctional DNase/RNase
VSVPDDDDLIAVTVKESALDFASGQYRVLLQDDETNKVLSIWVGHFEGSAIAMGLDQTWTPRPMTHDLLVDILTQLSVRCDRVVITDLRENTFYAAIHMTVGGREIVVDSRPSDAIAIAVRRKVPLFVRARIADKMGDEMDDLFDRMQPSDTVH